MLCTVYTKVYLGLWLLEAETQTPITSSVKIVVNFIEEIFMNYLGKSLHFHGISITMVVIIISIIIILIINIIIVIIIIIIIVIISSSVSPRL